MLKQNHNKLLSFEITVIVLGGLLLASINGYEIYIVGYSILLSIIAICIVFLFALSYKDRLFGERDFKNEIEELFGTDIDGNRPRAYYKFKELGFPL